MMRMKKTVNCVNILKRMLMLCLCLALLAGCACADNVVEVSVGDGEQLDYQCALPDGRLLLTGSKVNASDSGTCARLVCLNPDGTLSWDYSGPEQDNVYRGFYEAVALEDGTVAAVLVDESSDGMKMAAHFFTQDGKPTGKEIEIQSELAIFAAEPSCLVMTIGSIEGDRTEVFDWDGNKVRSFEGIALPGGYGDIVRGDEQVVYGQKDGRAKIMKTDGLTDTVLWETTLDFQWPDTKEAKLYYAAKTEDGGYAALLWEIRDSGKDDEGGYRKALVKFDAEGNVQWINREEAEENTLDDLFVYGGNIVLYPAPPTDLDTPVVFRWFDGNGQKTGTTELTVKTADCAEISRHLAQAGDGERRKPAISRMEMIPGADGLTAVTTAYTFDEVGLWDTAETILFKVPVLQ